MENKQQIPIIMSCGNQKETSKQAISTTYQIKNYDTTKYSDKYDFEDKIFINSLREAPKSGNLKISDLNPSILNKLFYRARFFIIKSNNFENVYLSKQLSVWATPPANEKRLDSAFYQNPNVFLIFSVRESGLFQGFARIRKPADHNHKPIPWCLPSTISASVFSGIIKIDWITKQQLPFLMCNDLKNPYNDNKEVKISRDGQEIEPKIGEILCRMFDLDPSIDVESLLLSLKHDDIIEKYNKKPRNSESPDYYRAKSRSKVDKSYEKSRKEYNRIPKVYFDKLVELTDLPYEEYVSTVSCSRYITTLANLGVYQKESDH